MSEKNFYPPSPPPGEPQQYGVPQRILATQAIPEERSELEKQAWSLMDSKLIPFTIAVFIFAGWSRGSTGTAAFYGSMQQQFNLTDAQYGYCGSLLFVPYNSQEFFSSLLLRYFSAKVFFPAFMVFWGVTGVLLGLVTSDAAVVTVKAFMGPFLWTLCPAAISFVSLFYTRRDLSLRLGYLFAASTVFDLVMGVLETATQNMNGFSGKPMWAWLLILTGLFTIGIGIAGYFLIGSGAKDCNFFPPEQKELIMARLERDRPTIVPFDVFTLGEFFRGIFSPHVLLVSTLLFMVGTVQFGLCMSLPAIIQELGFDGTKARLLGGGPFLLGVPIIIKSASISDNNQSRGITTALLATVSVAGHILFFATNNKYVAYAAVYLMVAIFASTAPLLAWLANNSEPYYRQATSIAFGFMAGNSGCVLSTWVFSANDGPKYRKTATLNLVFCIAIILFSVLNVKYLSWKNNSKTTLGRREVMLQKYSEDNDGGLKAWMELGDEHPDFRYIL